ncbi:hypothetical protein NKJ23_16100 [Mesorhizobium sp. M0184]|uniref:hypothetical protein n=1 Tax=Mesorhizobium sp. M0184 TaxID=2956906 RepID=UPI003338F1D2
MLRFSYEWVADDGEDHWSDHLYAIYDSKLGMTDPIAWTWTRDDAERIVDALNLVDGQRRQALIKPKADPNDLSDLLA